METVQTLVAGGANLNAATQKLQRTPLFFCTKASQVKFWVVKTQGVRKYSPPFLSIVAILGVLSIFKEGDFISERCDGVLLLIVYIIGSAVACERPRVPLMLT